MNYRRLLTLLLLGQPLLLNAGATYDGSMGTSGSLSGNFTIPASAGQIQGNNLFHSFQSFSIDTGESATFSGPASTTHLIARVTGSSASSIDGLLDTAAAMPSANFYLINPNGVIINANARLNIGNGLYLSTADYLQMGSGSERFYAVPQSGELLSSAPPSEFGFVGAQRGSIVMNRNDVSFDPAQGVLTLQQTPLTASSINLTADQINLNGTYLGSDRNGNGGPIEIRGNRIVLNQSILDAGGQTGGDVTINSGDLRLLQGSAIYADSFGTGSSNQIQIDASHLVFVDRFGFIGGTTGDGNGVNININTRFLVTSDTSAIASVPVGGGDGGNISISADLFAHAPSSLITTSPSFAFDGSGNEGLVTIAAFPLQEAGIAFNEPQRFKPSAGLYHFVDLRQQKPAEALPVCEVDEQTNLVSSAKRDTSAHTLDDWQASPLPE